MPLKSTPGIGVVVFDVGETLVDEARLWAGWADYLGVPREAFRSALEEVIAQGQHHHAVFERFRPGGFDIETTRRERAARGEVDLFEAGDLYPDALPALGALRARGFRIGIAANQPAGAEAVLRTAGVRADFFTSSTAWGVAKPAPEFFLKVIEAAGVAASEIAYVGDRLDNDVLPARRAGMLAAFLERGPWGRAHAKWPEASLAHVRLHSLAELPGALAGVHRPR
jgi:HAD superfamily hydrolase (TIGR01549 family)